MASAPIATAADQDSLRRRALALHDSDVKPARVAGEYFLFRSGAIHTFHTLSLGVETLSRGQQSLARACAAAGYK
jgi:hypothetical protein